MRLKDEEEPDHIPFQGANCTPHDQRATRAGRLIVFLTGHFAPIAGGIAQIAYSLARRLGEHGWEVEVLATRKALGPPNMYDSEPFAVKKMRGHDWRRYEYLYSCYYLLPYGLRQRKITVVAMTWGLASGALALSRRFGWRVIIWCHGLEVVRPMSPRRERRCRDVLHRAHRVVAVSRFTAEAVRTRFGLPDDKVLVLSPGVDPERFHPSDGVESLRRSLGLDGKQVILTLARLIARKGHVAVVNALPIVLAERPDVVYLIGGKGRGYVEDEIRRRAKELGVSDAVRLVGFIPDEELSAYYSLSDIYIMLSEHFVADGDVEGYGITFLEAGACAKPVIGGKSGGVPEAVVDGETGYIVDPQNPDEVAERILTLLNDPEKARAMGERGRERVLRERTWEHVATRFEELLH